MILKLNIHTTFQRNVEMYFHMRSYPACSTCHALQLNVSHGDRFNCLSCRSTGIGKPKCTVSEAAAGWLLVFLLSIVQLLLPTQSMTKWATLTLCVHQKTCRKPEKIMTISFEEPLRQCQSWRGPKQRRKKDTETKLFLVSKAAWLCCVSVCV